MTETSAPTRQSPVAVRKWVGIALLWLSIVISGSLLFLPEESRALGLAGRLACLVWLVAASGWLCLQLRRLDVEACRAAERAAETLSQASDHAQEQMRARTQHLRQEIEIRKAIETRLERALDSHARQLAHQRDFSTMLSHELRTPLAIIDTASQSLQLLGLEQLPDAAKRVDRIRGAVLQLDGLVNSLSSIERLDDDAAGQKPDGVELAGLARKVVERFSAQHPIALHLDAEPCVPGDAGLLEVAVANLASNAIKYAGSHGPISIRLTEENGHAHITVRDSGPGIAAQDQVRIFERSFRSANAGSNPGAGHGLFLLRRICDMHAGSISTRNLPEGGCEFVLTLPVTSPAPAPAASMS